MDSTQTIHDRSDKVRLRLVSLAPELVEFELVLDNAVRDVVVRVGSGVSWYASCRFPNLASQAGESTGYAALDEEIRSRAAEELVRLEARWAA